MASDGAWKPEREEEMLMFLPGFASRIRATVRSKEKAEKWESRHRSLRGDVDWRVSSCIDLLKLRRIDLTPSRCLALVVG